MPEMNRNNLAAFYGQPWLIVPEVLVSIRDLAGQMLRGAAPPNREAAAAASRPKSAGTIAVLSMHGVIMQRSSWIMDWIGGTSTDDFGSLYDAVMRDDKVKGIVVDIDSPGGTVPGVQELSDKIYASRGQKPVVGVANSMAASAAYWAGTAFDRLYVTPGGDVGSVGVRSEHYDWSKAEEAAGIKTTVFQVPKYKAEFHPSIPLSDESKEYEQAEIERIYGDFVGAVARNRGTTAANVRKVYGEGRLVDAKTALERGMVDKIATLEQVIARMAAGRIQAGGPAASDDWETPLEPLSPVTQEVDWQGVNATERLRSELRRKGVLRS